MLEDVGNVGGVAPTFPIAFRLCNALAYRGRPGLLSRQSLAPVLVGTHRLAYQDRHWRFCG